ncbi:unnamed protein product [Sphagnum jensenii]|uniref:DUF676 domain-containing protein n=1 Tax=Sphagnum jensenii TaxID=128206 RepID=A0ABP0WFI6_9BRYO
MATSSSDWSVHQLWPPFEGKPWTELDVVLFHGLQSTANDTSDAWSSTWAQRGHDDVCWPREWLPYDLGEAVRIFSVSYNAHVVTSPDDHVSEIAHNLFQNLMDRRYEWDHPIVLIGHSFGGLVLKSLVVKLKRESTIQNPNNSWSKATVQRGKVFLRNVRGVAFYAVPHAGSTNFRKYVNKLRCNNRHHPGIMDNIQPWQRDMEQLSVDFDCIVTENEIIIYAFCEGRPMAQVGILVDFSLAQRSAGDNCYKVEDANHMETNEASILDETIEYIKYMALQRRHVEQLGMVHQSSSEGNIEVMNYGVNENGDHYLSGMKEAQVEDMDSEPENAWEGYHSDGTPSTCSMLVSSSWLMHEVVKMVVIQVE